MGLITHFSHSFPNYMPYFQQIMLKATNNFSDTESQRLSPCVDLVGQAWKG